MTDTFRPVVDSEWLRKSLAVVQAIDETMERFSPGGSAMSFICFDGYVSVSWSVIDGMEGAEVKLDLPAPEYENALQKAYWAARDEKKKAQP